MPDSLLFLCSLMELFCKCSRGFSSSCRSYTHTTPNSSTFLFRPFSINTVADCSKFYGADVVCDSQVKDKQSTGFIKIFGIIGIDWINLIRKVIKFLNCCLAFQSIDWSCRFLFFEVPQNPNGHVIFKYLKSTMVFAVWIYTLIKNLWASWYIVEVVSKWNGSCLDFCSFYFYTWVHTLWIVPIQTDLYMAAWNIQRELYLTQLGSWRRNSLLILSFDAIFVCTNYVFEIFGDDSQLYRVFVLP